MILLDRNPETDLIRVACTSYLVGGLCIDAGDKTGYYLISTLHQELPPLRQPAALTLARVIAKNEGYKLVKKQQKKSKK